MVETATGLFFVKNKDEQVATGQKKIVRKLLCTVILVVAMVWSDPFFFFLRRMAKII